MADLKKLTVRELRALARERLGAALSKLKTRDQLLRALEGALRPGAAKPPTKPTRPADPPVRPTNGKRPPLQIAPPVPKPAAAKARPQPATVAPAPAPRPPAPEPFPSDFDERLGELPETYHEDSIVLMAKDPGTLYLHWDCSPATLERAFAWMPGLRTRLRLYDGERILREADFSVDARSWYFHGLAGGRTYRVELIALAEDGQLRRIGRSSNPVRLPAFGPSRVRDDRFVRIPYDLPTGRLSEALRQDLASLGAASPIPTPDWEARPTAPGRRGAPRDATTSTRGARASGAALPPTSGMPVAGPRLPRLLVAGPALLPSQHERLFLASGGDRGTAGSSDLQPEPPGLLP